MLLTGKHFCWSLFLVLSVAKFLRPHTLDNICVWLLLKMCSWNWKKLKFIRSFNFTIKNQYQYSTSISETIENVCFYFMIGFPWSLYLQQYFFGVARNNFETLNFQSEKHFPKTISQWEFDYGLFTNLPRIVKFRDSSPSSFKLKRGIQPFLAKDVS